MSSAQLTGLIARSANRSYQGLGKMNSYRALYNALKPWTLQSNPSFLPMATARRAASCRTWKSPMESCQQKPNQTNPSSHITVARRSISKEAFAGPVTYCRPSVCDFCLQGVDPRPCFDLKNVVIERASTCHAKLVRSFLYTHHWPREPSVTGLWMALDSQYLQVLTERYANSGERFLAFELEPRTKERRLIGVLVANKVFPWEADELEQWAHYTISRPERHRMYLVAHCLRSPDLFTKYHADYVWDVQVLTTAAEVTGHGVATLLLHTALKNAVAARYPLPHVIAYSTYVSKICQRLGLTHEWSMKYSDFVDMAGQRVFFPRRPHLTVSIYTKPFSCQLASETKCKDPW